MTIQTIDIVARPARANRGKVPQRKVQSQLTFQRRTTVRFTAFVVLLVLRICITESSQEETNDAAAKDSEKSHATDWQTSTDADAGEGPFCSLVSAIMTYSHCRTEL